MTQIILANNYSTMQCLLIGICTSSLWTKKCRKIGWILVLIFRSYQTKCHNLPQKAIVRSAPTIIISYNQQQQMLCPPCHHRAEVNGYKTKHKMSTRDVYKSCYCCNNDNVGQLQMELPTCLSLKLLFELTPYIVWMYVRVALLWHNTKVLALLTLKCEIH